MAIVCYRSNTHSLWKKMKVEIHWRIYFIFFPVTWIITIGQCRFLSLSLALPFCYGSVLILSTFSLSFLIFLLIWQWFCFCFFFFHKIRNIARALNGFYSTSDLIYCMFTEKRQVLSLKERKKSQKMLRWYYSLELCVGYGAIFPMYPPRIDTFMLRFRFSICNFFQRQFQLQLKIHRMRENLSIFKSI